MLILLQVYFSKKLDAVAKVLIGEAALAHHRSKCVETDDGWKCSTCDETHPNKREMLEHRARFHPFDGVDYPATIEMLAVKLVPKWKVRVDRKDLLFVCYFPGCPGCMDKHKKKVPWQEVADGQAKMHLIGHMRLKGCLFMHNIIQMNEFYKYVYWKLIYKK